MSNAPRVVVVTVLLLAGGSGAAVPLHDHRALRVAQAAPPPAAGPPAAADTGAGNEPAKTVLDKNEIQGILGKVVRDSSGKEMGRIVNVIVDRNSQPRAAVIDFGGFLGVGSRKIAVDWNALSFGRGEKRDQIALDLTRDQLKAAPEYKDGRPVVVVGAAGSTRPLPGNDPEQAEP